jgi:hypothetical protein
MPRTPGSFRNILRAGSSSIFQPFSDFGGCEEDLVHKAVTARELRASSYGPYQRGATVSLFNVRDKIEARTRTILRFTVLSLSGPEAAVSSRTFYGIALVGRIPRRCIQRQRL